MCGSMRQNVTVVCIQGADIKAGERQRQVLKQVASLEKSLQAQQGWTFSQLQQTLMQPQNRLYVLLQHQQCIGYCLLATVSDDEAEILLVGIATQWQQQGLATYLLNNVVAAVRQQHIQHIFLEVKQSNLAAIALYHKLGFKQVGLRKQYYTNADGTKEHALVLQKLL